MPNTHLLFEVTSPDPDKTKIVAYLSNSALLLNEGATLFYQSQNFCIFLIRSDTNYWLCFYGLPKSLEKDMSSQVLNFLEERISNLNFKFPEIPRDAKSQRFRQIRSISGIRAGFVRSFNSKPTVRSIVGDGIYLKKLWSAVTNRKSLPLAPWEKNRLFNNFFDTKSSDDTLEKNQRLKELEFRVSALESEMKKFNERFESVSSNSISTEGINQTDLKVAICPPNPVPLRGSITPNLESARPTEVELGLIPKNLQLQNSGPKKADSIEEREVTLNVVNSQVLNSETQNDQTKPQFNEFEDLVIGKLDKEAKLNRTQFLNFDGPVCESFAFLLIYDYWRARKKLGTVSKSKFFSSHKVGNDLINFRLRHLKSLTWDGSLKDTPKANFRSELKLFLEAHIDDEIYENSLNLENMLKIKLPILLNKGKEMYS